MSALVRVRPAASLVTAMALAILAVVLFGPTSEAHAGTFQATPAPDTGSAQTVDGTWHRWNPIAKPNKNPDGSFAGDFTGAPDLSTTPSVTVSQTKNLVDQVVRVSWKNFTPSSSNFTYSEDPYANHGRPAPGVEYLDGQTNLYPVDVLECRGTDPKASYSIDAAHSPCYPYFLTSGNGSSGLPNAVHSVTQLDGTGYVDLHIENRVSNNFLGCDATHPCSIAVVPNNGGMQTNTAPTTADEYNTSHCDDHSSDFEDPVTYEQYDFYSDQGHIALACSWADRIVVPIHFAPLPTNCPTSNLSFNALGSPMLGRSLNQLLAGWCSGSKAVNFEYNSTTAETDARFQFGQPSDGLTAPADVALVTRPADPSLVRGKKFTYAPIANNAIAIPYYVDDVRTGRPMTDLVLNARLVAKLLTQSYQPFLFNCYGQKVVKQAYGCAANVYGNPISIFDDPEFQSLNMGPDHPDHPDRSDFPSDATNSNNDSQGGFFPTVVAGQTDLTYELTRWIESDPAARQFMEGQPDHWGMRINSSYQVPHGSLYPTDQFSELDPGWSAPPGAADRFVEGFQGTWNPLSGLSNVATTLVGARSTGSQVGIGECADGTTNCFTRPRDAVKFPALNAEPVGARDLWAVTDEPDARAFQFPTARIENSDVNPVAPTDTTMAAALRTMHTNPDGVTQYVDHADETANAYPLTVPDYAMVPTCGLSSAKAAGISSFLTHVLNSTTTGVQPGTLTPGLIPLDGNQRAQLVAARRAVSTQACTSPPRDNTIDGRPNVRTGPTGHTSNPDSNAPGTPSAAGSSSSSGARHRVGAHPHGSSTTNVPSASSAARLGFKPAGNHGSLGLALPIVLAVGAAFLVGAPLGWWFATTGSGQAAGAEIARRLRFRP